jgi:hypothetical protein
VAESDGAAVRVGLDRVEAETLVDRDRLRRKGFVGLDDVHLIERQARLLEHQLGRRDRTFAHDLVRHAGDGVGNQTRDRLLAGRSGDIGSSQHQEGGTVVDARCVAGGHRSVLDESRLHLGQRLDRRAALTCSSVSKVTSPLRVFMTIGTICDLKRPSAMAAAARRCDSTEKRILLFAADVPLLGQILGSHTHVTDTKGVVERRHHHVDRLGIAHTCPGTHRRQHVGTARHHFHTAADTVIGVAEQDVLGGADNALQTRGAQAVDRHGHRIHRQAGLDRRHTSDIGKTRIGRNTVADGDVVDLLRIDTRAGDRLFHYGAGQFMRLHVGQ